MAPIIIFSVVLLGLYGLYRWLLPRPLLGIPYNPEAAKNLFGDIPNLIKEVSKTGDVAGWFTKQAEKVKSPVIQLFITPLGPPSLMICDFRIAQDVLLHRVKDFDRSSFMQTLFYGIGKDHHITMKTGPEWKGRRRLLQDLMSPAFLNEVAAPSIYASCLNVVQLWGLRADMADGRPFSALQDIYGAALDAVLAFALGAGFKENATRAQIQLLQGLSADELGKGGADDPVAFPTAPMGKAISGMLDLTGTVERARSAIGMRFVWWRIMREKGFQASLRAKNNCLHEELEKAVQARARHQEEGDAWVRSAVDHMVCREAILAEKEGRPADYHSVAMVTEVFGFIVAGHDTSSTTLSWAVKFLAEHPRVQDRLRSDMQAAFAAAKAEGRLPTVEEITKTSVPYLEATIEEILRVGNTVPIIDREAVHDTTLQGYRIPKGTQMLFLNTGPSMLTPTIGMDESRLGPQDRQVKIRAWPDEDIGVFKPERWLAVGDGGEQVFDSQAGPAMPFSLGLRGCFGRRLAYLELRLLLTVIVWSFELLECPASLSGHEAVDGVVHTPKKCFVRLRKVA